MRRSIPRYTAILNEMETHNIYESQRLDRLIMTLEANQPLTPKEKEEAENLKHDSEELRLTKRKAIYLKKGILMAKAKLVELQNEEKHKHLAEYELSHFQELDGREINNESRKCYQMQLDSDEDFESIASRTSTPNSLAGSNRSFLSTGRSVFKGESSTSMKNPRTLTPNSLASSSRSLFSTSGRSIFKNETTTSMKNPKEHCVSESRVTRALKNDGLPLSVKIPLPLKDDDQCVLMGVQEINKLLLESKISSERSRNTCSFLPMPKSASTSCLSPPHSQTSSYNSTSAMSIKSSRHLINTPHLNQYESAMKTSYPSDIDENFYDLDPTENVGQIKKV